MPKRFSRRWWKLWYSGAIDREKTFLSYLADELEANLDLTHTRNMAWLFEGIESAAVRRGELLSCADAVPRAFLDLGARCAQDLHLHRFKAPVYDNAFIKLIEKTAVEYDKRWRSDAAFVNLVEKLEGEQA